MLEHSPTYVRTFDLDRWSSGIAPLPERSERCGPAARGLVRRVRYVRSLRFVLRRAASSKAQAAEASLCLNIFRVEFLVKQWISQTAGACQNSCMLIQNMSIELSIDFKRRRVSRTRYRPPYGSCPVSSGTVVGDPPKTNPKPPKERVTVVGDWSLMGI